MLLCYKSDYTEGIGKTTYFTDDRDVTLYTFRADSLNKNKFTRPDFSNNNAWPIYETDKIVVPSTFDKQNLDPLMSSEDHSLLAMDGHCTILDRTVKPGDSIKE